MNKKLFTLIILCSFILYTYAAGTDTSCTGTDILFLATNAATAGDCVTLANAKTHCATNKFAKYQTNPSASTLAHCGNDDAISTTCAICVDMTKCATVAYSSTAATGGTAYDLFPTAATDATTQDRCITCQAGTDFPKISAATDVGGTCTAWATPGCTGSTDAVLTHSTSLGLCTTITASGINVVCAGWTQAALFADNAAALAACTSCAATLQTLVVSAAASTSGYCVLTFSPTTSHCATATQHLLQFTASLSTPITWCTANPTKCAKCTAQPAAGNPGSKCSGYNFASGEFSFASAPTDDRCSGCTDSTEYLFLAATGNLYGTCKTVAETQAACVTNNFAKMETNPTAKLTYCGGSNSATAAKCAICSATMTTCATVAYFDGFLAAATAIDVFPFDQAEPTNRCLTCQAGTHFPKATLADDKAGTCTAWASHGCTAGQYVSTILTTVGFCANLVDKVNAGSYTEKPCGNVITQSSLITNNAALALCSSCGANQVFLVSGETSGTGFCVLTNVDTRTYCATNSFLLYLAVPTGNDNRHANCQASATTCAVCSVSTNCATFFYAANIASATLEAATGYVFATKTAAEAQCKTCIGSKLVQISATGQKGGSCIEFANHGCTGTTAFILDGTFYRCYTPTAVDPQSDCLGYSYSAPFASDGDALSACTQCGTNKALIVDTNVGTVGSCVNYDKIQSACSTEKFLHHIGADAGGTQSKGYCDSISSATVDTRTAQKCQEFYYTSAKTTFADNAQALTYCVSCATPYYVYVVAGTAAAYGTCRSKADLSAICSADYHYLQNPASPQPFGFCTNVAALPSPYSKCATFFYSSANFDAASISANQYCATCTGNDILLVTADANTYGRCISAISPSPCADGSYVKKISASVGICTAITKNGVKNPCATFYYGSNLWIDESTGPLDFCESCSLTQYFFLSSSNALYGKCLDKTPTAAGVKTAIGGDNKFLQFVGLSDGSQDSNKVIANTAPCCKTFKYILNKATLSSIGAYRDIFEARNDCGVCADGLALIADSTNQKFSHCEPSNVCSGFSAGPFASLQAAELTCTTCRDGFFLKAASGSVGVCTPSTVCQQFSGSAPFADAATAEAKCIQCAPGYVLTYAASQTVFGSCTLKSEICDTSSAPTAADVAAFNLACTVCKAGYYKIAKADASTIPCVKIPDTANCLLAAEGVLTDVTVVTSCALCKAGYFPLNAYGESGTCTAFKIPKKTCLEFGPGGASTEALFETTKCTKCPSEFFYLKNGECRRCPGNCRTCFAKPDFLSGNSDLTDADFCTSCLEGYADLALYTGGWFGKCLSCSGCQSCSGVFVNTAPEAFSRKCESCAANKYFAFEAEFDSGICKDCDANTQHCQRCSSAGACAQCEDGFFLNKNEMQCQPCKADCATCRDKDTCLRSLCVSGCQECTANNVDACTKPYPQTFKSSSTYEFCFSGCLECTSSAEGGCTKWSPSKSASTCPSGCNTCSANTAADCSVTSWGYFKQTIDTTTTIEMCASGCKTCTSKVFADCQECGYGYFKNDQGQVCERCHRYCAQCTGPTLKDCQVLKQSPAFILQAWEGSSGYVAQCDYNFCKTCGGKAPHQSGACTSCWDSQVVVVGYDGPLGTNGICAANCPDGTFKDGNFCRRCILGSPAPCPQPPAATAAGVSASYLTLPILLIAFIIMLL